jgi:hypothetical protein
MNKAIMTRKRFKSEALSIIMIMLGLTASPAHDRATPLQSLAYHCFGAEVPRAGEENFDGVSGYDGFDAIEIRPSNFSIPR